MIVKSSDLISIEFSIGLDFVELEVLNYIIIMISMYILVKLCIQKSKIRQVADKFGILNFELIKWSNGVSHVPLLIPILRTQAVFYDITNWQLSPEREAPKKTGINTFRHHSNDYCRYCPISNSYENVLLCVIVTQAYANTGSKIRLVSEIENGIAAL
uniref:Uncharacterized protein n=1 Tax=Glossina brevipalpis TaxID=37001 RepID=A0A1A9WGR0_9MUSC